MSDRLRPLRLTGTPSPNPVRLPTDRASLAWLYAFCASLEGVSIERDATGHGVAAHGPRLAIYSYLERMRSLPPLPQAAPARRGKRGKRRNRP